MCTFVISPKTISAIWSDETVFDFDESTHAPYVVTEGQEYDGQVTVSYTYYTISGEKLETVPSQVGEYYVEAKVESKNYVLSGLRKDFEIRDAEEVQEALQEAGDEFERAWAVWSRRYGNPPEDYKEKTRQARFLAARGFGFDMIERVFDKAREEACKDEDD